MLFPCFFVAVFCVYGFRVQGRVFRFWAQSGFLSFGFNVLKSIVSETKKQWACAGVCAMGRSKDGVVVETAGKLQEFATYLDINKHIDINIAKT